MKQNPFSLGLLLSKLLADNGKVITLLIALVVALGFLKPEYQDTATQVAFAIVTWLAASTAKGDLKSYFDYVSKTDMVSASRLAQRLPKQP